MNNTVEYKNYIGSVEFSEENNIFFGKVLGIRSLIMYEGKDVSSFISDFHDAVDDYLSLCEEKQEEPEIPYKGSFNVRVTPKLHKDLAIKAIRENVTLNKEVELALSNYVYGI